MNALRAELVSAGLQLDVPLLDAVVAALSCELFPCTEDVIGAPPLEEIGNLDDSAIVALQKVSSTRFRSACPLVFAFVRLWIA